MGTTIAYIQQKIAFKRFTPICDNCMHRQITHDATLDRTERLCMKHDIFVMKSSTCNDHLQKRRPK